MDFEYTGYVHISKADLQKMYKAVKKGTPFKQIFYSIMSRYDDEDYYCAHYVYNQVEAEINRRLSQNNKQKSLTE